MWSIFIVIAVVVGVKFWIIGKFGMRVNYSTPSIICLSVCQLETKIQENEKPVNEKIDSFSRKRCLSFP